MVADSTSGAGAGILGVMRKIFRAIWRPFSFVSSILAVLYFWPDLQGLPAAYGYRWGELIPERETVIFFFLCLSLAWIVWIELRPYIRNLRGADIKGKIRIGSFNVSQGLMLTEDSKTIDLVLKFTIHNYSPDKTIHFLLTRGLLSIDGRINPAAQIIMPVYALHPGATQDITLAMISGLELKEVYTGTDDVVIRYGSRPDKLEFVLEHEGVLNIQLDRHDPRHFSHDINVSHRRVEHRRANKTTP